ncbi:hypothetical protein [Pseudomonas sp.]|uniref:hypothetical protein n=1 Tax=Pseudomonas sp. TaxID=306 RepID=UPI0027329B6F|nr:hypothetical protein [Pseudomonas sp.]MDP3816683.1 hypothetical protein [Pseudomonas sp.]
MTESLEARIASTEKQLIAAVNELGATLTGDLRVSEEVAAQLLGTTPGGLKQARHEGRGPRAYAIGAGSRTRISYRLSELATYIEESFESFY